MSTTSASFNTCERIIRMAAEDAMLLEEGTDPTGDQYAKWFQKLQDLVVLYQTQGLKLFLLQDIPVTLVAGTNTYSLGPTGTTVMNRPWKVEEAYYLDTSNQLTPLTAIAWKDWLLLPNKTATGAISQICVDKQVNNLVVYTWQIPDATTATGTLHLLLRTQLTYYASLNDSTLFPPEWFIALRWGLADEICGGQSDSIMQRCNQRAIQFRQALEAQDVEDTSVFFGAEWNR
jgi:hypothetical protein